MRQFVSKPRRVEAVRWGGGIGDIHDMLDSGFIDKRKIKLSMTGQRIIDEDGVGMYELEILAGANGVQGFVPVPIGHWVVRVAGDDSDYWPVEHTYFTEKYEEEK